ncbi:hypothetical protein Tco_0269680 [Tanacetum coccineum]
MSAPKFADSYNMVAFLAKPTESDGFEQILDFLNVNPIKYALTVNPTIYTLCIEQFWATAKVETVNGEVQLQALVYGKKVIITETSVRRNLQLEDAEGMNVYANADILSNRPIERVLSHNTNSTIPKAKSITFRDPVESTTRPTLTLIPSNIKDKGKAKMIKPEEPLKMKEQIRLDEELAFKLQLKRRTSKGLQERRLRKLLAERLQAREQKLLTDEEKARLFVELLEKRKIAALRAQEKRNKPPAKAQKKSTMSTYLKTWLLSANSKKAEERWHQKSSKRAGRRARTRGRKEAKE